MKPKIFNSELRDAFLKSLEVQKDAIAQIKASTDAGSFEVVVSTEDQDRQGEVVKQEGWDLGNYMKNPIVLWAHDYSSLPIGICDEIRIENGQLVAKGRFAPEEANPFAQQVRRLYDLKIVRATSVGFIATNMEGNVVTQAELLEFSFVPVPANPMALSMNQIRELALDLPMLAMKGIDIKEIAETKSPECRRDGESKKECIARKIPEILKDNPGMKQDQAIAIAESMCSKTCGAKDAETPGGEDESDIELEDKIKTILDEALQQILEAVEAEEENEETEEGEGAGNEGGEGESGEGNPEKSKSGRRISNATRQKIEEAIRHLEDGLESHSEAIRHHKEAIQSHKAAYAALKELLATAEPKPGEGEEPPDGEAPNERSSPATSSKGQEELDTFLLGREIVRQIEAVAREGLGKLNARTRKGRSVN